MAKRQNFAWLTLLRLLANQLIILAKQTAHTHTERDHKFPVCVCVHYALICAIYLRCVNFFLLLNRQPSGGEGEWQRGNGRA